MADEQHTLIIDPEGELVESTVELPADPPDGAAEIVTVPRDVAVALREPLDPMHMTLDEIGKVGRVFAQSGMFKDARDAAQAIVKIMAGQELGIGPFQAMAQFHVVEGKPTMSSGLIGALAKRSGRYNYIVLQATDQVCELEWTDHGEIVGRSQFSIEDAKRAKVWRAGSSWEKYPSDMCFARALTQGARRYCPDVFGGAIYSTGELGGEQ